MNKGEFRKYIKDNYLKKDGKLENTVSLENEYSFLLNEYQNEGKSFKEKLYLFLYNKKTTKCLVCGENVKFIKFSQGYRTFCSTKCSAASEDITNKKKYGKEYVFQSEDIKRIISQKYLCNQQKLLSALEKRRDYNLSHYGVENVSQHPDFIKNIKNNETHLNI